jgi:hypothetical protein
MPNCPIHPARTGIFVVGTRSYCAQCQTDIAAARARVDRHVQPRDCFVWYEGGARGWQPIPGTGCAHWVLHQLNRTTGGGPTCLLGYPIRVNAVTVGRRRVELADVQVNDIYVSPTADHTGLVIRVVPATTRGAAPSITIRHDSSGQGRVAENEFATYFHGHGTFYR